MHQMRLLSASLVLAFGLAACGGSDSTSAPAVPVASASSGVLVDDLIAGATVFCDDDSDGVLDAGEKSAVTDSAGAYVSRPGRFFGRFLNKSGDLARQDLRASRGV